MLGWDKWQTALAVRRAGTYAGAAGTLNIDASTVGRRIKSLEKALGHSLFLRSDGKLFPNRECAELLDHVEHASECLRRAEQRSARQEQGVVWRELRITSPPFLIRNLLAPALAQLPPLRRLRLELLGTGATVSLHRREADIALRVEDRALSTSKIDRAVQAECIGELDYAVYIARDTAESTAPDALPWAGLLEEYVRSSGTDAMLRLAADKGIQFSARHFDAVQEIAASGVARALLPCLLAERDPRLMRIGGVELRQRLLLHLHRQDAGVAHVEATCDWIRSTFESALAA